ncbi:MAG: hypothetical protein IT439_12365 [Phycisphaerales bacterium]|nr:hypothetical protein [Phycisphaerales bacterium]
MLIDEEKALQRVDRFDARLQREQAETHAGDGLVAVEERRNFGRGEEREQVGEREIVVIRDARQGQAREKVAEDEMQVGGTRIGGSGRVHARSIERAGGDASAACA